MTLPLWIFSKPDAMLCVCLSLIPNSRSRSVKIPVKWVACLLMLWSAGTLTAAKISRISFEQKGVAPLSEEQLYYNIRLRTGDEHRSELIDEDVKRLFSTGNFSDVVAVTEPQEDGGVALTFRLRLKPQVMKIIFDGNAKFQEDDLRPLVTLAADAPLNDAGLRETLTAIRKFYKDKGYNDATVTPLVEPVGEDQVNVTLRIRENLRLKIARVRFEGASVYSQAVLRDAVANRSSFWNALPLIGNLLNAGLLDRAELENDSARIRNLYLDKGYLDFSVEKIDVAPTPDDPEYVNLTFHVSEGKPYQVGSVGFAGNEVTSTPDLELMLRLKKGGIFSASMERETIKAVTDHYESMGYVDVAVRPRRFADFRSHTVDVTFVITEGRRYAVHDVVITGNIYTKDKVIRRELAIQPGDPVDRNRIEVSRSRLMGMGYFNKVEATTSNADAVDEKDVNFRIEEKPDRFQFKIGAGFSDVNSLVGMAEISSSNFDLLNPGDWFYGGGQRVRLQALVGIERIGFNFDFSEPWLLDLPMRFDLSLYGNQMEFEHWDERRYGGRVSLNRRIFDDFTTVTGTYKFEQVNVLDMSHHVGSELRSERGRQWVSQTSLMVDRDTRDSLVSPTSGYNLNLLAAVSPKIMGSSSNFYRLEAKGSYYYSFFEKAVVAMGGFRVGTVSAFSRTADVPLFERYFLGGGDSLRGFPFREVSPLNHEDDARGGQTMILGTFEISHPIWSFIRGAAFVDVGNTWKNAYSFGPGGINLGAGYGLRIQLPMINAPIKLDLAYPVVNNQDDVSSKLRFHFNMGFTW